MNSNLFETKKGCFLSCSVGLLRFRTRWSGYSPNLRALQSCTRDIFPLFLFTTMTVDSQLAEQTGPTTGNNGLCVSWGIPPSYAKKILNCKNKNSSKWPTQGETSHCLSRDRKCSVLTSIIKTKKQTGKGKEAAPSELCPSEIKLTSPWRAFESARGIKQ